MTQRPDKADLKIEDLDPNAEAHDAQDLEPSEGELDVVSGGHGPMLSTAVNGHSDPVPN